MGKYKDRIISYIIGCLIGIIISVYTTSKVTTDKEYVITDTIYNTTVLDSIEYKVTIRDSIIIKLKKKVVYETEQAINANDSDAVKQFRELASE